MHLKLGKGLEARILRLGFSGNEHGFPPREKTAADLTNKYVTSITRAHPYPASAHTTHLTLLETSKRKEIANMRCSGALLGGCLETTGTQVDSTQVEETGYRVEN